MARDECVGCGVLFPGNKELLSVPQGRMIAFDPAAGRVWRICETCDGWNLLGVEAAQAALPELSTRFASQPAAGADGITMAVLGNRSVVLLRVGSAPTRLGAEVAASETHASIGAPASWQENVGVVVILIAGLAFSGWLDKFPTLKAIVGNRAIMLALVTHFTVYGALSAEEVWRGQHRAMRLLYVLGFPVIAFMFDDPSVSFWGGVIAIVAGTVTGLWAGRRDGVPRGIRWVGSPDTVTYHDGEAQTESGRWALVSLSLELQRDFDQGTKPADREAAWALWVQHRSLASLLTALEPRRRRDALLRLSDLTARERMALLTAVGARLAEPPDEVIAALRDAEEIAAIAEALDRPAEGA